MISSPITTPLCIDNGDKPGTAHTHRESSFISADLSTANQKQSFFLSMPAGKKMFWSAWNRVKRRVFGEATVFCERASWVEWAAGRRIEDAWHLAGKRLPNGLLRSLNPGNRGHKGNGVRMQGIIVKPANGGLLDNPAHIHHGDDVAGELDDGEVMCDEQVGEEKLLPEVFEEVEDLGLDGDVEGTDGFVADDEFRLEDQRAGNADTLSLAAGEFVWVAVYGIGRQTYFGEDSADVFREIGAGYFFVDLEWFADDAADGHSRIERAEWVLENQADV
jgi:hypothetical protein